MSCHTKCAVLNITSCVYNTLARQVRVQQVEYDSDGCFRESDYLRDGDKYHTFLEVSGNTYNVSCGNLSKIVIFFIYQYI